jgi:hypothetical protein
MATTRVVLGPESANYPTTNFAIFSPETTTRRPSLKYIGTTANYSAFWQTVAWQGLANALTAVVYFFGTTNSSNAVFECVVEAVLPDNSESAVADSYGTQNKATTPTIAVNTLQSVSITLTNNDGIAAGELVRFKLTRLQDDGSDTNTGDVFVTAVEIREA